MDQGSCYFPGWWLSSVGDFTTPGWFWACFCSLGLPWWSPCCCLAFLSHFVDPDISQLLLQESLPIGSTLRQWFCLAMWPSQGPLVLPLPVSSIPIPNVKKLPGGSFQPSALRYRPLLCQDNDSALMVEYEFDFQDVTIAYYIQRSGQRAPEGWDLRLGGSIFIFTHWEP